MYRKTIVVDFDGVLNSYDSGWFEPDFIPDKPVPGAMQFLRDVLQSTEYMLKISSARNAQAGGIRAMQVWLKFWLIKELGYDPGAGLGNELMKHTTLLPPSHTDYWDYFPLHKPSGWITIDDRAILFKGAFPTFDEINSFKPWNKQ